MFKVFKIIGLIAVGVVSLAILITLIQLGFSKIFESNYKTSIKQHNEELVKENLEEVEMLITTKEKKNIYKSAVLWINEYKLVLKNNGLEYEVEVSEEVGDSLGIGDSVKSYIKRSKQGNISEVKVMK